MMDSQTQFDSIMCSQVSLECSLNTTNGQMRSNHQNSVQCKDLAWLPVAGQLTQLYICALKIDRQQKQTVEIFMMAVRLAILLNYEKQKVLVDKSQLVIKRAQMQSG